MQTINLLAAWGHFRGFVRNKNNNLIVKMFLLLVTWHGILNILLLSLCPQRNLILISFACLTCLFAQSADFGSNWRCPETKWFKDLFYRVDSICSLCQTNTQQFERTIKWKWKFEQLKDEAHFSLKSLWVFCQNVWFSFSLRLYWGYTGWCSQPPSVIHCLHLYCAWCWRLQNN